MASVAQFSDLLATKPELANKKHILTSLQESSQAAVTLLDNLLYWGRSQADELRVSPEFFDVEKLVREVESLYLHMAIQKDLKFNVVVTPDITAYADPALINIVIRNLVSNAIKFTPREGIVAIRVKQEGDDVQFTVTDSGVGIKPEILDLFLSEGQLDSSTGTELEIGTGLGLQLVKDLVERNGGVLKIESELNKGSAFAFTLPTSKKAG